MNKRKKKTLIIAVMLCVVTLVSSLIYYNATRKMEITNKDDKKKTYQVTKKKKEVVKENVSGDNKKMVEVEKKREEVIKENMEIEGKEKENGDIVYYEDVSSFIDKKEKKNGTLTIDEEETLVDKEFGKNTYDSYRAGYMPSKKMSPMDNEILMIEQRQLYNSYLVGFIPKTISLDETEEINEPKMYRTSGYNEIHMPTTDGFVALSDGKGFVGYPTLLTKANNTAVLEFVVYFNEDITVEELSNYTFKSRLGNYRTINNAEDELYLGNLKKIYEENGQEYDESLNVYKELGNFTEMNNDVNSSFYERFLNSNKDRQNKVMKNTMLTYQVRVDMPEEDISKLNKEIDVYIEDTKVKVVRPDDMSLEATEIKVVK